MQLVALKVTNRDGKAAMEGDVVTDADQVMVSLAQALRFQ